MRNIFNGDCLTYLKENEDRYDICVSSPPYNIGMKYNNYEDNRKDYVDWQIEVWNEVCKKLNDDGHLFINMASNKKNPFDPYKIAEGIDWKLQNNIIWAKSVEIDGYVRGYNTPTTSTRYLKNGWEHLFHFTKEGNNEINLEWSGVPYNNKFNNAERMFKKTGKNWTATTNCWHITYKSKASKQITKSIAGDKLHPAIFPEKLIEKCIKVSGLKKGILFDPFAGTGTSLRVAKKFGLDFFGCEIDKDYCDFIKQNISQEEIPF